MVHRRGAISCGAQIAYAVCLGHRPAPVEWIEEHMTGTVDSHQEVVGHADTGHGQTGFASHQQVENRQADRQAQAPLDDSRLASYTFQDGRRSPGYGDIKLSLPLR